MAPTVIQGGLCSECFIGPLTIFQRLRGMDRSAVADCLDRYGPLIWTLAKACTGSIEEAESLTAEIFEEIWRSSAENDSRCSPADEEKFISHALSQTISLHEPLPAHRPAAMRRLLSAQKRAGV